MMFMHRFEHGKIKSSTEVIFIRTLVAFSIAAVDSVWSIYMNSFGMSDANIGYITSLLVLVNILGAFIITPLLEKFHEKKVAFVAILGMAGSFIGFMFTSKIWVFVIFAIIYYFSSFVRSISLMLLLRDNSTRENFTKDNGLSGSLINLGWFIGPLIGGYVYAVSGVNAVFIYAIVVLFLSLVLYLKSSEISEKKHSKKKHSNLFLNLKYALKSKKIYFPFLMQTGISFWWALIFIYVPLLIINSGLGVEVVGIFISASMLPLAIFENYAGKKVNSIGFRLLFILGFTLLGVSALASFFIGEIIPILFLLVIASLGMAFIETLPISFFFSKIKDSEEEILTPIFNLSPQIGSFLSKAILASFILFFNSKIVFLVTGVIMFIYAGIAYFMVEK